MEFKSQICTTREQSQRLLSFGLNPETADMYIDQYGFVIHYAILNPYFCSELKI